MTKAFETVLTLAEREVVAKMIGGSSLEAAAAICKVAPQTLRALAGGLSGRRGTLVMVRAGIATDAAK